MKSKALQQAAGGFSPLTGFSSSLMHAEMLQVTWGYEMVFPRNSAGYTHLIHDIAEMVMLNRIPLTKTNLQQSDILQWGKEGHNEYNFN